MRIMGLDEAGRGCVAGPLVVGCAYMDNDISKDLIAAGVKDSKLLSDHKRRSLRDAFDHLGVCSDTLQVSVEQLNKSMHAGVTLTTIECEAMAQLIVRFRADCAIIDCPSVNIRLFEQHLRRLIPYPIDLIVAFKADVSYPIVGAASIAAKVQRDDCLAQLAAEHGIRLGSGYPSDPITKKALAMHRSVPVFRTAWATYKRGFQTTLEVSDGHSI